jgi:hypothetical protein
VRCALLSRSHGAGKARHACSRVRSAQRLSTWPERGAKSARDGATWRACTRARIGWEGAKVGPQGGVQTGTKLSRGLLFQRADDRIRTEGACRKPDELGHRGKKRCITWHLEIKPERIPPGLALVRVRNAPYGRGGDVRDERCGRSSTPWKYPVALAQKAAWVNGPDVRDIPLRRVFRPTGSLTGFKHHRITSRLSIVS